MEVRHEVATTEHFRQSTQPGAAFGPRARPAAETL
jgi:hypothetical protein